MNEKTKLRNNTPNNENKQLVDPDGPRFEPGEIIATDAVQEKLGKMGMLLAVMRHLSCNWGEVSEQQRAQNETSFETGQGQIRSSYTTMFGVEYWVVTKADRSSTTILLPEEY